MKKPILIASAAMILLSAPAYSKPDHAKQGGGKHGSTGYGAGGCPPGLAKKNNGCMPPGQAKKLYNVGQRYPKEYGQVWKWDPLESTCRHASLSIL